MASWGEASRLPQDSAQPSSGAQAPDSSTTQPSETKASSSQTQTAPSAPQNPPPQPPASGSTTHSHSRKHKKNVKTEKDNADCPAPVETAKPTGGGDQAAAAGSEHGDTAKNPGAAPPANCPPSKKVVSNGGTAEPTIRLVGGAKIAQASDDHSTTEQLLGATEENLKKIAGRQLDSTQQETVNQINQFVEQSKAAVAAGDADRGHNLALKARLLSDELGKP